MASVAFAGDAVSIADVRDALAITEAVRELGSSPAPAEAWILNERTMVCSGWFSYEPIPPGYVPITYQEYLKCRAGKLGPRAGVGTRDRAPAPGARSPVGGVASRDARRRQRELFPREPRAPRAPRAPREPRPPRAPRAPRAPRVTRPRREPRPPRAPRVARPPRPPRAQRQQTAHGFWYCKVNYYPGVGEVMAGPHWAPTFDPSMTYTPGQGGYLPVPSPFACNGETCTGPLSGALKKAQETIWGTIATRNANLGNLAQQELERRRQRSLTEPTAPTAPVATGGSGGIASGTKIPPDCRLWFTTNQAAWNRIGMNEWVAPHNDDPVARFGGAYSDYGSRYQESSGAPRFGC